MATSAEVVGLMIVGCFSEKRFRILCQTTLERKQPLNGTCTESNEQLHEFHHLNYCYPDGRNPHT